MAVPLVLSEADNCWTGVEDGVRFEVRPRAGRDAEGTQLRERSEYQLLITAPTEIDEPSIAIGGFPVTPSEVWARGRVAGCVLALGSEFGRLELTLTYGERSKAACWIDVRPRYLDAERDVTAMQADLRRISLSLAYALWRRTFHELYPDREVPAGLPEWLGLLRSLWGLIERKVREIERNPDREIVRRREVVSSARATRVDAAGIRWLAKNPDAWERHATEPPGFSLPVPGGFAAPAKALVTRNDISYDTPANRVIKAALVRLERELSRVVRRIEDLPPRHFASATRERYREYLEKILFGLRRYLRVDYLSEVREDAAPRAASVHIARTDARYRQLLRALDVLRWGLVVDVTGPATRMYLKDTWQLYEYWVFLYVLDLLRGWGWSCERQGVLTTDSRRPGDVLVDVVRGEESRTRFEKRDPETGALSVVTVFFHRGFRSRMSEKGSLGPGALTVARDVDIYVEIQKGAEVIRVVLDPKYRAESERGCLVCPESAIDDMHVYRDAIGRWAARPGGGRIFERSLRGAFAVFPSRDEVCLSGHRFVDSLEDGIGALPLLPSEDPPPKMLPDLLWYMCH